MRKLKTYNATAQLVCRRRESRPRDVLIRGAAIDHWDSCNEPGQRGEGGAP